MNARHHVIAARLGDAHGLWSSLAFRPGRPLGPQVDDLRIGGTGGARQQHQSYGKTHGFIIYRGPAPAGTLKNAQAERPAAPVILVVLNMANPKYAASDKPVPVSELVDTLSDGTKVKLRTPRMRACNEKDAKEKLCAGHLKRWYFFGDEVKKKFGADVEIYRCEHCKTLYLPNPEEEPRTGTLSF